MLSKRNLPYGIEEIKDIWEEVMDFGKLDAEILRIFRQASAQIMAQSAQAGEKPLSPASALASQPKSS